MIQRGDSHRLSLGWTTTVVLLAAAVCLLAPTPANAQIPGSCLAELNGADLVDNDFGASFCELCDRGTVRIVVENPIHSFPGDIDLSEIVVREDLQTSGLTYVPNSTTFQGVNVGAPLAVEPTTFGSVLTWTLPPGFELEERNGGFSNRERLIIEFEVERLGTPEALVSADRAIQSSVSVEPSCAPGETYSQNDAEGTLDLREPIPNVRKQGRNVDAGQNGYSDTVYAHEDDDVIWRIRIRNDGDAPLQDFEFSDSMVPDNFVMHHVCDSAAEALSAANGADPPGCADLPPNTTDIDDFDVRAGFNPGANPYIVAQPGATRFYYLVGRVIDSCTNRDNTVHDVRWGCQIQAPTGNITTTSTGFTPGDTETLSTDAVPSGLEVDVDLEGVNTAQPMGARGTVTITISNNSGGTIYDPAGIELHNLLPIQYVVDTTAPPTLQMDPAYGNAYPGMVDTITWDNFALGTVPLVTTDPDVPLQNRDLEFTLTSSTVHPDFSIQRNMIRHGDVVTITIRTVLIDPVDYDLVGNLDVRSEAPGSTPPDTDPRESFPISDTADIWFTEFCTGTTHHIQVDETDTAEPEDLDVDIVGNVLEFILTNTGDPLPLTVALTNEGGHDAQDYQAYVTFGEAMAVQTAPAGCAPTSNPPPLPNWQIPVTLPATATVYACNRGTISPGETELFDFEVVKNTAPSFDDDLTFRADVVGEITLADSTPLWFPEPQERPDGITDRANNYTLDAVRARVVGFNLFKDQVGICTENNPPPATPDDQIQIGEQCTFHVESGGWFGFETPGFTYIAVQNVQVIDENPDGQGYLSSTNPLAASTAAIQGVSADPSPSVLGDGFFGWRFNTNTATERITERDHWFRVDFATRLLNDPIDDVDLPNRHAEPSTNVLTSTFQAVFHNPLTASEEVYDLGPSTVGFPREVHRRVDLTVTEPRLLVEKMVCNETLNGAGPTCSTFLPLVDDGDAYDTYIYRVRVTNEDASGGVTRAPAYDVTVTSLSDASDMLYVDPLPGDGLDNDADTLVDGADPDGEGVVTDNVTENGLPAEIIASYTHSNELLRIDPGETVELYYRVDPDDDVAPLQALTNTVSATYDSLEGPAGSQTAPIGAHGEIGGARRYESEEASATIQIIPVEVSPKQILRVSDGVVVPSSQPQPVSIGEEVEFQLQAMIPVAQLRNFVVRDVLPDTMSCAEAPTVDLDEAPYDAAGFVPGGEFVPTCTDAEVVWDFGDQTVTQAPGGAARFDFAISFIARIDNVDENDDGDPIENGGTATVTTVSYVDELDNPVVLPIDSATVLVREPAIALSKSFSVALVDAADVPTVTITATNEGTAPAYNLRVLDDLTAVDLSYVGNVGGANPPTVDLATFGPDQPLFSWLPDVPLAPGESLSFTFEVEVGPLVEPHQILSNTAQADWTSLPSISTALNSSGSIGADGSPTGMRIGALPNAAISPNLYETEADATLEVAPPALAKLDLDPTLVPEIGAHKAFEVVLSLSEGATRDVVVRDSLDSGDVSYVLSDSAGLEIVYTFQGIASINGAPASEAALTAVPADGTLGTAVWLVGDVVTQTENDLGTPVLQPEIRIRYLARINNDDATDDGDSLRNGVQVDYTNGESGAVETLTDDTPPIVAVEPLLSATKAFSNVTIGKGAADPPAFGDTLQYVVTVINNGTAFAYDVNVRDILPPELTWSAAFAPTATIDTAPVAGFVATPSGPASGPLLWGAGNGDQSLDLAPFSFLQLTYQVTVTTPVPDATEIANAVWVDWTSLDSGSPFERTGVGCSVTPTPPPNDYCVGPAVASETAEPVPGPERAAKLTTQPTASVGEQFTYRIEIPTTEYDFPVYDIRILDDLSASAANMRFVSVEKIEGSVDWTPVNTGTPTSLVIEDPTGGIDIPADERIIVEVTVVLEDTSTNVNGLPFSNRASYIYNWINEDETSQRPVVPSDPATMTIVEPDTMTLEKSGPAQLTVGPPGTFTLDVHNTGTGPAWNLTVTDRLPNPATGGTCDAGTSAVTAQVFEADRLTAVSPVLVEGTDFAVTFQGAPTCLMTLTTLTPAAVVGADQRLLVSYEAELDSDAPDAVMLTNIAGATEWFSAEGPDRRTYTRTVTDGSPTQLDHQDAFTLSSALPQLRFEKTVENVTMNTNPAVIARPGDRLRYRLEVVNLGTVALTDFSLYDEVDRLNATPLFERDTLQVVTYPGTADASGSSGSGGAAGTGLVDVQGLSLPNQNDSVVIEFEVVLAPVIADGSLATNQSELRIAGTPFLPSDDPAVNGQALPLVPGDEDRTVLPIESAPDFSIEKVSDDMTGDPALLEAGDTLRYTITVKNVGTDDASDAQLRDAIPVNTQYVAGSTTLNGSPVADGPGGVAPLAAGIAIHAPENPTAGVMRADTATDADNVATLLFDVVVDPGAVDGTVISNQAFVSALVGGVVDQPSDDPGTPLPDDPTRDVVGDVPLLFAAKDVALENDVGANGVVDPGDTLRYTISIVNSGGIPATAVTLRDAVPANTQYVAGSTTRNSSPVPDGPGGAAPLASGIAVNSPTAGAGTVGAGETALVEFVLQVNGGVASGTLISNQAVVTSAERPTLLTDGDGNPATGPEPTVVVVGAGEQLTIAKSVSVVGGGAALPGSQLEYVVQVTNVATVPASNVVLTDAIDLTVLSYVNGSATMNGSTADVNFSGSVVTADYSTTNGPLAAGGTVTLRFLATINGSLPMGTPIANTGVVTWDTPPQTASSTVSLDVGGLPGVGILSGALWHDADFNQVQGSGERALQGWTVELRRNSALVHTTFTDVAGGYQISGVAPNDANGDQYSLHFRAPGASATTASLGQADSPFTNGMQQITDVLVTSGGNLLDLNLPITPNGVVYDSVQRIPVAGARVSMMASVGGAALPVGCFADPTQQGQVTLADGYYKFDLDQTNPTCSTASYVLDVAGDGVSYGTGFSGIIPPVTDATTAPLSVPMCPGTPDDAVTSTTGFCETQASELAPPTSIPARTNGTDFHTHLAFDASQMPGSSQIFNNHLAVDPMADSAVAITKTTPATNVVLGQLVPYEITVYNQVNVDLSDLTIVDRFPAGFRYVEGSAKIDGTLVDPVINGRELTWTGITVNAADSSTLVLLLAVGAGVGEGEYVNQAQVITGTGGVALSGAAQATVRVVPAPEFACTDVIGKVFDDKNRDGFQDEGERGLTGVRLVTPRGLAARTDEYGRFHITCAIVPHPERGSNMVLKLDDRSLPTGYRLSTRQVQVKRATQGKALRFHYGASVDRVVGLDLADAVFEPGTTEIREQWQERIELVVEELEKAPATLRLAYVADVEESRLVDRRMKAVKAMFRDRWRAPHGEPLPIESEVYWRRGAPPGGALARLPGLGHWDSLSSVLGTPAVEEVPPGAATERIVSPRTPFERWAHDPALLEAERGDRVEERAVPKARTETVKLKDVVPPIRFVSGRSEIPRSTLDTLRRVLSEMRSLANVRLHLVGHADDRPLTGALAATYGDNDGLSRERAGEVAEFVQDALRLPAEAISFSWAGASAPVASNATPEGRARNRRVEVEVWYDEIEQEVGLEEVVVPEDVKRVKVCRSETVCKMRFLEGHEHRARVKNLIAPLRVDGENARVPREFVDKIERALQDLRDRENVTVKFVGYTDDAPLTGRAGRIYGTHLALSKAMARRVSLAVRDALSLPTTATASEGHGSQRPLASNDSPDGRALNRRIEVEFWYDDPLQELPDEPQVCPDAGGEAIATHVYDPPWGSIPALRLEDGRPIVPPGYTELLERAMSDVEDEPNVRLRFVGYTSNDRLDRRSAMVYGDDIGLSTARARRTMETLRAELGLTDAQTEHEGRGYLHSKDVVNAGFIQGHTSHVEVQVVYDEPRLTDDWEGVEITPITRELQTRDPLALNLMRITVDGEPLHDTGRNVADVQRCTDVALERASVQFRFDDLETAPRLSVASSVAAVAIGEGDAKEGSNGASPEVAFRMYTNYAHFIERAEVRIFDRAQSQEDEPLATIAVGQDGLALWRPEPERISGPVRELAFVLRAYDAEGRFDETAPQTLWMVPGAAETSQTGAEGASPLASDGSASRALQAGYGENDLLERNIDLGSTGTVRVHGHGVPPRHTVWVAGNPVPVDERGRFVAEAVLPEGLHTVEVAVLDEQGNGDLFLRDLEIEKSDWFYVAMADLTVSGHATSGASDALQGQNASTDPDSIADGRLAFFVDGKFGDDWRFTASADTRERPIEDLFENFLDKSPDALFRRMDPDYFYPTYGDDGTVEELAPTQGKFFAKLSQNDNHALWGNFKVGYRDTELTLVERGLYGGNLHFQTDATTHFGERRVAVDGFAADPGTLATREEFRGTGGSLYYLRHRDILMGSERLRIEIRDRDSGLVAGSIDLSPDQDYDIDYIQGRVLLNDALPSTVDDHLLVRVGGLSGNEAWLVAQYEYAPGFDELDALAAGGQAHWWINDFLKVGATAYRDGEGTVDTGLYGANLVARKNADSWMKGQVGYSSGLVSDTFASNDGGFDFFDTTSPVVDNHGALSYRGDLSLGFGDIIPGAEGRVTLYFQRLDAGYSAPGLTAVTDTDQYGGTLDLPITHALTLVAKADRIVESDGLKADAEELDLHYQLTDAWDVSAGVRNESRKDGSPLVPLTQEEGGGTDVVLQSGVELTDELRTYVFGQMTVRTSGDREKNRRGGVGGAFRLNDRMVVDGEVSYGDDGPGVRIGTDYQETVETRRYLNYSLDNERGIDGRHARRGNLVNGVRTRLSDSASVFQENRLQHGDGTFGTTRTMGMDWSPTEHWILGADWETGTLRDGRTRAETDRNAGGARVSYRTDALYVSSGVEYRRDEQEQLDLSRSDRTTWLFRNSFRLQLTPDWRLLSKYNRSFSNSSLGDFFDGGYTEAVLGFAYRPIASDRLDVLAKYTYFYNLPATDQVGAGGTSAQFLQKSHIASLDVSYDLTRRFTLGGKYAYRRAEVSLDRVNPDYFDNDAHLVILRADWRFLRNWETSLEGRTLILPDLSDQRSGAVFTLYRYLGKHLKLGVGYNFTDYSDDLTDLSFDRHGFFFNLIGTL